MSNSDNKANSDSNSEFDSEFDKKISSAINNRDCNGDTSLIRAVRAGDLERVKNLIKLGADKNITNNKGSSAIYESINCKNYEIFEFLTEFVNISKDDTVQNSLTENVRDNNSNNNSNNNSENKTLNVQTESANVKFYCPGTVVGEDKFYHPVTVGSEVKLPKDNKVENLNIVEPTEPKEPKEPTEPKDIKAVEIDCPPPKENNVKETISEEESLSESLFNDPHISDLVNKRDNNDDNALTRAIKSGNLELLKKLIKLGGDLYTETDCKGTLLHLASSLGHLSIVDFLIKSGLKVNHKNSEMNTPLHCAVSAGSLSVIKFLIDSGADISSKNKSGDSPFIFSIVGHVNKEIVKLFLSSGVDINMRGSMYFPVEMAVISSDIDLLDLLCKSGADMNVKTTYGQSLYDLATLLNHKEIIEYLNDLKEKETRKEKMSKRLNDLIFMFEELKKDMLQ